MKGIHRDRISKCWIVSDGWGVFFGFSGIAMAIYILYGVLDAIM
jgi:hypothetical protein